MPYFKWIGIDIVGTIKKGRLVAHSKEGLEKRLLQRGVALLQCSPAHVFFLSSKIAIDLKTHIFSSIAYLLKAGIIIPDVFLLVAEDTNNPRVYDMLFEWATDIKHGVSFVTATKKQHGLCDSLIMTMLSVGHESGSIAEAFENAAAYYSMRQDFKRNMWSVLAMPLLTFVFFVLVTLFIFICIIPRFAQIFLSMNSELPFLTKCMIDISDFITSSYMIYSAAILVLLFAVTLPYLKRCVLYLWNRWYVNIPFLGTCLYHYQLGQIFYALSLLVSSNVSLPRALVIVEESLVNKTIKENVRSLFLDVQAGMLLSQAMAGTLMFDIHSVALIRVGEESGALGRSLLHVADLYKNSAQVILRWLIFLIQPLLIIILGLFVGILILSIYLPIMSVSFSI